MAMLHLHLHVVSVFALEWVGEGRGGGAKLGVERAEGEEGRGVYECIFFLWLVNRIQRCGVLCFSCCKRLVSRIYPYRIRFPQLSYLWFCSIGLAKRCGGAKATLSDAQLDAQLDTQSDVHDELREGGVNVAVLVAGRSMERLL